MSKDNDAGVKTDRVEINKKKTVQVIFYDRPVSFNLKVILTHIVAVYIVIYYVFIKFIRGRLRSGRSPLFIKLVYPQVI